jgi:hypothetical protein
LFRRDILEGTLDEMTYKEERLEKPDGNGTDYARPRRQTGFPDITT